MAKPKTKSPQMPKGEAKAKPKGKCSCKGKCAKCKHEMSPKDKDRS